jgi:hypothetical protein
MGLCDQWSVVSCRCGLISRGAGELDEFIDAERLAAPL